MGTDDDIKQVKRCAWKKTLVCSFDLVALFKVKFFNASAKNSFLIGLLYGYLKIKKFSIGISLHSWFFKAPQLVKYKIKTLYRTALTPSCCTFEV